MAAMPGCLFLLLALGLPAFDVWLLFRIGGDLGGLQTFGLMLLSMFVGLSLARFQRATALRSMQAQLAAGAMPTSGLADGPMLMLASLLFVLPGFITDGLGLLLLVPPLRRLLFALIARRMLAAARDGRVNVRMFGGSFGAGMPGGGLRGDGMSGGDQRRGDLSGAAADGSSPGGGPFGPQPGSGGAFEAAREIKELPRDSYRVREQDEPR